jgi:hypothetical protein
VALIRRSDEAKVATELGLSGRRIRQARTAPRFSVEGDLANDVMAGAITLHVACQIARQRRDAASSEESWLGDLRRRHLDLADKVVEGETDVTWTEAEARSMTQRPTYPPAARPGAPERALQHVPFCQER